MIAIFYSSVRYNYNRKNTKACYIIKFQITMGDNVSAQEKKTFEDKLLFVQKADDPLFGPIDIFRFKEPPYEYIMDYQKTFIQGDVRYQPYSNFMQCLREKQHKNLAKLHFTEISKEAHMCIKDTKVHTYCNYYNFTLRQGIEKKKMKDCRFSQPELTYIMSCLLDLSIYLKSCGIVFGDFRSDHIYLSPQGYIKVYTLDLDKQNKHTAYYKALVEKSLIEEMVLSPQQLFYLQRLDYEPKLDVFKAQIFAIAMIILQLMTRDKIKFYYNEDKGSLKMGRINFDLSSLNAEYSHQFIDILRGCLMENPKDRLTLEAAFNRIEQLRKKSQNVSYCIRLHDQDDGMKKKTGTSTKGQYILSGIQKRLTPSPITTLASSTSSGFQTSKRTSTHEQTAKRFFK